MGEITELTIWFAERTGPKGVMVKTEPRLDVSYHSKKFQQEPYGQKKKDKIKYEKHNLKLFV